MKESTAKKIDNLESKLDRKLLSIEVNAFMLLDEYYRDKKRIQAEIDQEIEDRVLFLREEISKINTMRSKKRFAPIYYDRFFNREGMPKDSKVSLESLLFVLHLASHRDACNIHEFDDFLYNKKKIGDICGVTLVNRDHRIHFRFLTSENAPKQYSEFKKLSIEEQRTKRIESIGMKGM